VQSSRVCWPLARFTASGVVVYRGAPWVVGRLSSQRLVIAVNDDDEASRQRGRRWTDDVGWYYRARQGRTITQQRANRYTKTLRIRVQDKVQISLCKDA
jgi:hypothetical protein